MTSISTTSLPQDTLKATSNLFSPSENCVSLSKEDLTSSKEATSEEVVITEENTFLSITTDYATLVVCLQDFISTLTRTLQGHFIASLLSSILEEDFVPFS